LNETVVIIMTIITQNHEPVAELHLAFTCFH